jgi:ABC-2 type transport system ATP-binding protein
MTDQPRRARHLLPVPSEPAQVGTSAPDVADDAVAVQTIGAGARYGGRWALADCSLRIPQGSVVAVVGRNGAGKSTLLQMLAGLRRPDAGSVTVLGDSMWPAPAGLLSRVGYVGQHKPLYGGLRVAELLTLGRRMNPSWDQQYAIDRLRDRAIPFDAKVGKLSGGQRTQVALVMALAKRPSLLLLDEPLSDLDPVARREVMGTLMVDLAERNVTVVLSSHSLADLTRACDWLVLVDAVLAGHQLLIGPTELADRVTTRLPVISEFRGDRQAILLVEGDDPAVRLDPRWTVRQPTVEDLVFAYMKRTAS